MKLYLIVILAYAGYVLCDTSTTKDFYDPEDEHDKVVLWKSLFTRVNAILMEVNKMSNIIHDIEKRQEDQGKEMSELMEFAEHFNNSHLERPKGVEIAQVNELDRSEIDKRLDNIAEGLNAEKWTTVLRRHDGSVDFYRNWADYKSGFGNPPYGEYFIGLERLYQMTKDTPQELMVVLRDWQNEERYALYDGFKIGSEEEKYKLIEVGNYTGNAGDSFIDHLGSQFSTFDQENDRDIDRHCARYFHGGWWYHWCYRCHLSGVYQKQDAEYKLGVSWDTWHFDYSYQFAEMKLRSKST